MIILTIVYLIIYFYKAHGVAYAALVVFVVGVVFLCLVDKLAIDGVLLLPFHGDCDALVALVAGDNPYALFAEVSCFFHVSIFGIIRSGG